MIGRSAFLLSLLFLSSIAAAQEVNTSMFQPLPDRAESAENPITPEKHRLGKTLFFDTRLSKDRTISCNSCHDIGKFGVDNKPVSEGHKGQKGERNSPTVYNAALHFAQFWDGRAKDVEEQALGPILNPVEMSMAADTDVLARLREDENYRTLFKAAFPEEAEPITFKNLGKAIGAYERTLLTPSRFDDYLKGKKDALTAAELEGLKTFVNTGCIACHSGVTIGGQMYQKLGLVKPYPTKDTGRFKATNNEADKYFFKVPSLRNIAETGPYFHDGSIATLEQAVKTMADIQLGRNLSDAETASIVTFLKSLSGRLPAEAR
jgi:cytochrome c peroxidase